MGVFLAKLAKKHDDLAIKQACESCMKNWQAKIKLRAALESAKKIPQAKKATEVETVSIKPSMSKPLEPTSSSSLASSAGNGGEQVARQGSATTVDLSSLPPRRRKLVEILSNSLNKTMKNVLDVSDGKQLANMCTTRAAELEAVMYAKFGQAADAGSSGEYGLCYRRIQFALGNNSDLARNVFSQSTDLRELILKPSEELAGAEFRARQEAERQAGEDEVNQSWSRDHQKEIMEAAGLRQTDSMFPCPACKSKNTNNYLKQTRSADEPMTTFLNCYDCGNRWRFNA